MTTALEAALLEQLGRSFNLIECERKPRPPPVGGRNRSSTTNRLRRFDQRLGLPGHVELERKNYAGRL